MKASAYTAMAVHTSRTETESSESAVVSGMILSLRGGSGGLESGQMALGELPDGVVESGVLAAGEAGVLDPEGAVVRDDLHPEPAARHEQCGEQPGRREHREGEHP